MKFQKKHLYLLYFFITIIFLLLIICPILLNTIQKINTELSVYNSEYVFTKTSTKLNTVTTIPTITPSPTITNTLTPEEIGFYQTPTWDLGQTSTATPAGFHTLTPSQYPTFIIENAVTATLAQPAVCPVEDPSLVLNPDDYVVHYENITYITDTSLAEMLSMGASFSQIKNLYDNAGLSDELTIKDMTNDGIDELIYLYVNQLGIVSCEAGKYETIFYHGANCQSIVSIGDMNLNGIPDFVYSFHEQCRGGLAFEVSEWNGHTMEQMEDPYHGDLHNLEYLYYGEVENQNKRLLRALFFNTAFLGQEAEMLGTAKMEIVDMDHNGTEEIRIQDSDTRAYLDHWSDEPLRELEVIYEWNGEKYLFSNITFSPPEFRFQAIQDADRYFLFRQYDEALAMYKRVISDTSLDYWTREWKKYNYDVDSAEWAGTTPPEKPAEDPDEYEILSAYARYRIMLIQMLKHNPTAEITYKQLQDAHPQGNAGYVFVQLARIYRETYDEENDFVEACKPVTEAAEGMDVELGVLGDCLHGQQSHCYNEADICPLDVTDVALLSGGQ